MAVHYKSQPMSIDMSEESIDSGAAVKEEHHMLSDSRTTGYVVKKLTGSTRFKTGQTTPKTGMHAVSIDTDSFQDKRHTATANKRQVASIDTDEFVAPVVQPDKEYRLIIDETEVVEEQMIPQKKEAVVRRERPTNPPSISLDISNDIAAGVLPSAERHDELGTGVVAGVLGSGGMAKVYKIWNEKLEMDRAVKVLLPNSQKEQLDRFMTEAKITAKLHHPNIIETYDCGEWRGLPIIEMELVEGYTLATLVGAHATLPSPVSVAIAMQVAAALSYAHAQEMLIYGKTYKGIIHRDLKPSNIMVGSSGKVKLMDFGVARPMETGLHTVAADSIVGTIHYFSPEQISGYPIDHLTDVYSFGAVVYELLSGKNPFPYSNMVSMIQAKTKNQFVRLEEYPVMMDERVASIAQTCLRTDKRDRYGSFTEIYRVLEEILTSYNMGSAEEVVAAWLENPAKVQLAYEHYYASVKKEREMNITVESQNAPVVEQMEPVEDSRNQDHWVPPRRSRTMVVVTAVAGIVLVAVGVLFTVKFQQRSSDEVSQLRTQVENTLVRE